MTDTLARPPASFERILAKRALLCALGPLAGLRAEGNATATATGAPVVLPPFTYGIPVIGGKAIYARMVKTLPSTPLNVNPIGTTVASSGTAVAVRAVCGGTGGNLPAGTPLIWQPVPVGIEPRGVVAMGGITGGEATPGPGRCARVVVFDTLGRDNLKDFWAGQGEGLPAILIGRSGDTPTGRATISSTLREHTFQLFVVSAHFAGNEERAEESELLLDAIESTLDGLEDVEGDVFSGPPVELKSAVRERPPNSNVHVWSIEASTYYALRRIDVRLTDGVSWAPWQTTRIQIAAPANEMQDAHTVVDVKADET